MHGKLHPESQNQERCYRRSDCLQTRARSCRDQVKGVYIVMLTAKGQEFDKRKGKEVGADIYITKPFNPDEIVRKAREVLGDQVNK